MEATKNQQKRSSRITYANKIFLKQKENHVYMGQSIQSKIFLNQLNGYLSSKVFTYIFIWSKQGTLFFFPQWCRHSCYYCYQYSQIRLKFKTERSQNLKRYTWESYQYNPSETDLRARIYYRIRKNKILSYFNVMWCTYAHKCTLYTVSAIKMRKATFLPLVWRNKQNDRKSCFPYSSLPQPAFTDRKKSR